MLRKCVELYSYNTHIQYIMNLDRLSNMTYYYTMEKETCFQDLVIDVKFEPDSFIIIGIINF